MRHDPLNDAICKIRNAERTGKGECTVNPNSKMLLNVLKIFQTRGYVGELEVVDNRRGGEIKVRLVRQINSCGVIKPRFPFKNEEISLWEKRYLPAQGFGLLIVSTPKGLMSHDEAKEQGLGGRLIAYAY
jgi:small subunit ribosomal protein S8